MSDDCDTIYTDQGDPIPFLTKDVSNYLDRPTLIFGGTGSGKTIIIEEILYLLKDHIPNFIVLTPENSRSTYSKKLPPRCIWEDITKPQLQKIWERQRDLTSIYHAANDLTVLSSLFKMTANREALAMLELAKRSAERFISAIEERSDFDISQKKSKKNAVDEIHLRIIKDIYKTSIKKFQKKIDKTLLTPEQLAAIEYIDLNPRLCLVIDDCSEQFRGWMKLFKNDTNIFESIFYRGRHSFITLIFAAHDDRIVDPKLRRNARVVVYTTSGAVTSASSKGGGFTPQEKKEALRYVTRIFNSDEDIKTHRKLCYIREDIEKFQYTVADLYPDFKLGCKALWDMTAKMPKRNNNFSTNPYVRDMIKVKP